MPDVQAQPEVITARLLFRPILGGCAAPRELGYTHELVYAADDPLVVRILGREQGRVYAEWVVAREVLDEGRRRRSGSPAHVEVYPSDTRPGPASWGGGRAGPGGVALDFHADGWEPQRFQVSGRGLARFLRRTYELVPAGAEIPVPVVDGALEHLMGGGSCGFIPVDERRRADCEGRRGGGDVHT